MEARKNDGTRGTEQANCRMLKTAGYLLLTTGLSLVLGCATAGKARVERVSPSPVAASAAAELPAVPKGPSVEHLAGGREGFVITERPAMNAQSRADFDRASALLKEAKYDQAIELLEKLIVQSPEMAAPRVNVAIAYNHVNKPEQAEQHLKKALELIPGHPVASNEYGLMLRKAGRFAEGRKIFEKSLAAFPEYYPIHKNLAILCDLYLKDPVCAVEHYGIYGQAMPKDPKVKLWLADLQSRGYQHQVASLKAPAGLENGADSHRVE